MSADPTAVAQRLRSLPRTLGPAIVTLFVLGWVISLQASCAARGARNKAQVGALAIGEAVLGLDQVEHTLYRADPPPYDKPAHDKLGDAILKALHASRAYERAVVEWPTGATKPQIVDAAEKGLTAALADVEAALPQAGAAREPLLRALAAARAAFAAQTVPAGGDA